MDTSHLTEKVLEHEAMLAAHTQELKTLFNQQKNIEQLTENTRMLAESVRELTVKMNDVSERVQVIEEEGRQRRFAVWQIVMTAVLGGIAGYVLNMLIGM